MLTAPMTWGGQMYFCPLPLRADFYGPGCPHGCLYCYSQATKDFNFQRRGRGIEPADWEHFPKMLSKALDWSFKSADVVIDALRHQLPIHIGSMADPFIAVEGKYKVAQRSMEIFNWYNYPITFSTKGTLISHPDYLKLLKEGSYAVQISLITDDEEFIKFVEPHAPSARARLRAMDALASAGVPTICRLQPLIPNTVVEDRLEEFITKVASHGVRHVVIEGYKHQTSGPGGQAIIEHFPRIMEAYRGGSPQGWEYYMTPQRKYQYVKRAKKVCAELEIGFGAADNDLRDQGSTLCCCGVEDLPGFENLFWYQTGGVVKLARESDQPVTLDDMDVFWKPKSIVKIQDTPWIFDDQGIRHMQKIQRIMQQIWDSNDLAKSPSCLPCLRRIQHNGRVAYELRSPEETEGIFETRQLEMF